LALREGDRTEGPISHIGSSMGTHLLRTFVVVRSWFCSTEMKFMGRLNGEGFRRLNVKSHAVVAWLRSRSPDKHQGPPLGLWVSEEKLEPSHQHVAGTLTSARSKENRLIERRVLPVKINLDILI